MLLRYFYIPQDKFRSMLALACAGLGFFVVTLEAEVDVELFETKQFVEKYCVSCHNPDKKKGQLDLQSILHNPMSEYPIIWEDVLWMMEEREMPPLEDEVLRPSEVEFDQVVEWLQMLIDQDNYEPIVHQGIPSLDHYCTSCHGGDDPQSGLSIAKLLEDPVHQNPAQWEKVLRKLHSGQMPPLGRKRPDPEQYQALIVELEKDLDANAEMNPNPGRTSTFRRLTRYEYQNSVRDLLGIEVDAAEYLPNDASSHGFDNITVTQLSPTLLDRYLKAARHISRDALGSPVSQPEGFTVRAEPDVTQKGHIEGLPFGTRGGMFFKHNFIRDGEYEFVVRLARDRNENVEGFYDREPHRMEILVDRKPIESFEILPPSDELLQSDVDKHLRVRAKIDAGQHTVGVTFLQKPEDIIETKRQPLESQFNFHRHRRQDPAVFEVSITGPFEDLGPGDSQSRQKIYGLVDLDDEKWGTEKFAEEVISKIARLAYRQTLSDEDVEKLMVFYEQGYEVAGFEKGIETAISAILVNPKFLFRIETDPMDMSPGGIYDVSDLELATRLSFFLWSSLPDDELLTLAEQNKLSDPAILERQVLRMLDDSRASALVSNFANQWLYLRNLDTFTPDSREYPDFDDNLREAMKRETELLIKDVIENDRSVIDLIDSDYTYLNERLAKHYDIPHIYGPHFRKVEIADGEPRGGLLRHASILTVTSYANRTSPVLRGNWILENLVGSPPPPPPPDVPLLEEVVDSTLTIRERLTVHRANPACAACHDIMDPIGFALENFDAIGRWRIADDGLIMDPSGIMTDGSTIEGIEGVESLLLEKPHNFVGTLVEKLMIYGLGRGLEHYDFPTVRDVVRNAETEEYKFSSLITGIVKSQPFQKRIVQ